MRNCHHKITGVGGGVENVSKYVNLNFRVARAFWISPVPGALGTTKAIRTNRSDGQRRFIKNRFCYGQSTFPNN